MKVLIQCGDSLTSANDWYIEMIQTLEGTVVEVLEDHFTLDGFVIKDYWKGPNGKRAELNSLDVYEVYDDVRLGKSICRSCSEIVLTGERCKCAVPQVVEIVPGSVYVERRGMDYMIDKEFSELLPTVK